MSTRMNDMLLVLFVYSAKWIAPDMYVRNGIDILYFINVIAFSALTRLSVRKGIGPVKLSDEV